MDLWGFETRTDLPGSGAGLFVETPAAPPAAKPAATSGLASLATGGLLAAFTAFVGADAAKSQARTMANAQVEQSRIFADARKAEAQELGHTRRWEAMVFADAKETDAKERTEARIFEARAISETRIAEARLGSETRITEAQERGDTIKHLSDNEVKVSRHENRTAWIMSLANSKDSQMLARVMKEMNSEKLDTKLGIAFKDADVRLAEIRSQERTAEGEHKVQTREIDARIAEAHRPESAGSDGLLA